MAYKNSKAQSAIGAKVYIGPKALDFENLTLTGTGAAQEFTFTADTTSAAKTLASPSSTEGLFTGQPVAGTGIPAGATLVMTAGVPSLSVNASATASAVTLTVTAFIELGEMSQVPLSGYKYDKEEVTNFDSGENKEWIKTLLDGGTVALEGNRVSSDPGQAALYAAFLDPANAYEFLWSYPLANGQVTTGDVVSFAALVEQWDDNLQVGKAIKRKASLQRTGAVSFIVGS
jgi:hypothetical protein